MRCGLEKDAGKGSNLSDHEYSEAGAKIVQSAKEVYQANVILKVEPLVEEEFTYIKSGTTLISALNLPALEKQYFEKLNEHKITGIGYELIEDKVGGKPIIRAMGEIAGSTVLLIAAEYLSTTEWWAGHHSGRDHGGAADENRDSRRRYRGGICYPRGNQRRSRH
jgi:alanine dehydrogenase